MGLFGFGRTPSPQTADLREVVAYYRRLRPTRLRLNNTLASRLSRDVLNEGAKKIGILRGGTFVFDSENEMSVLMDYCIYDVYRKGRNAIEEYLCECPPDPDSDETACLRAMQHATFALVVVLGVEPGVGCHVRNMFTEETRLLVDMGFSQTGKPGAVIATRLLDFGSFIATGGAALPLGILEDDELEHWQQKLSAGALDDRNDPGPLIRSCLQRGASSNIQYEGADTPRLMGGKASYQPAKKASFQPARTSTQERRALAKRLARKPATNRRCRCGSGKMFKNCCGRQ
ncbi:MAG: hypothetical protein HQ567_30195 [Candidatus Nealsonbacteria bacterium]|nr:hypothetical protein [Candidatus Nealsonbacteria bacterium]